MNIPTHSPSTHKITHTLRFKFIWAAKSLIHRGAFEWWENGGIEGAIRKWLFLGVAGRAGVVAGAWRRLVLKFVSERMDLEAVESRERWCTKNTKKKKRRGIGTDREESHGIRWEEGWKKERKKNVGFRWCPATKLLD